MTIEPVQIHLRSLDETGALAASVASEARIGDLILLEGGIASGKTAFARAFARAFGVTSPVTSPSFVFQNLYPIAGGEISHVDLYRLASAQEFSTLGLDDYFDSSITLIEWADRHGAFAPPFLRLGFELGTHETERFVTVSHAGETWQERIPRLVAGISS
jgi:tRNA threonylcarbamoyladenosine biosynthesis protein TsaE